MPDVEILGVPVRDVDRPTLEGRIEEWVRNGSRCVLAYVNVHTVNLAAVDPRFRAFLREKAFTYCDGEGMRLAARLLGSRLPPRIVLTYWISDLCRLCRRNGFSLFLLGGREETVERAVENIRARHAGLRVAGWHHGYFRKEGPENEAVLDRIRRASPDLLFVGFGMPLQEAWIERNLQDLGARVIFSAGSMIDYTAGSKSFAPRWMANHGLEWLYRLLQEPGRLWRRYLLGNPLFFLRVCAQRVRGGGPAG
ncbi:MAG: WecB/TagA/CpsF family glycosyltransferase [Bacteroidota bacterium]